MQSDYFSPNNVLVVTFGEDEEEIAAAQEAQRRAKDEARKELQKARLEESKEDAHAKVEELKSKLHRPKAGAAA